MPEANFIPFPSNQVGRNLGHAPGATPKRKLLGRLREAPLFRHSFAIHLLEGGYGIWTIQELLSYKDVSMTMIYWHVLNRGEKALQNGSGA